MSTYEYVYVTLSLTAGYNFSRSLQATKLEAAKFLDCGNILLPLPSQIEIMLYSLPAPPMTAVVATLTSLVSNDLPNLLNCRTIIAVHCPTQFCSALCCAQLCNGGT